VSERPPLWLSITGPGGRCFAGAITGPVELGRIDPSQARAERPFVPTAAAGMTRLPIADAAQTEISRRQVRVERLDAQRVRIANLSATLPVGCGDTIVPPGTSLDVDLPVDLAVGRIALRVADTAAGHPTAACGTARLSSILADLPAAQADSMVAWWKQVIEVLQSASHSDDFYQKATRALVESVGLDVGAVYVIEGDAWVPKALLSTGRYSTRPSTSVLGTVRETRRTFHQRVAASDDVFSSMATIDAVVAAPIIDREGVVIGALYGHRSRDESQGGDPEITHLETLLVEALASGVGTGLSRIEQERAAVAQRVQFEQFFGKELADQLAARGDLLAGRETEVSVLFCDIRGFSSVSERLTPARTMDWIYAVLSALSDEVAREEGVLVDYVGDELLAMWGAPAAQPDHARRACRAARRMWQALPELDARWKGEIGAATAVGIGVNSAVACVGNTGSTRKFKYGPLGSGVNLGSRVQGATKYLKVPAVVSGATRRQLDGSFLLRRLCSVRVVNIVEPVELFELDCTDVAARRELFAGYEEALTAFDAGNFGATIRALGNLLAAFPGDGPALVLLSRAVGHLVDEPRDFSAVWQLPGK